MKDETRKKLKDLMEKAVEDLKRVLDEMIEGGDI